MICYLFYNCLILRIFTTFPKDVGGSVVNTKFLLNDVNLSGLGGAKIWYIFSKMRLRHTQNYVVLTYSPQQRLLQGKNPARPCQASGLEHFNESAHDIRYQPVASKQRNKFVLASQKINFPLPLDLLDTHHWKLKRMMKHALLYPCMYMHYYLPTP